ncbi:MAG: hypothetical protein KGH72_05400 [Candidatus Micrarchaeota archaeon]|nr:hypothetical protein [Candidatus Micrarchaeota archaeon]
MDSLGYLANLLPILVGVAILLLVRSLGAYKTRIMVNTECGPNMAGADGMMDCLKTDPDAFLNDELITNGISCSAENARAMAARALGIWDLSDSSCMAIIEEHRPDLLTVLSERKDTFLDGLLLPSGGHSLIAAYLCMDRLKVVSGNGAYI